MTDSIQQNVLKADSTLRKGFLASWQGQAVGEQSSFLLPLATKQDYTMLYSISHHVSRKSCLRGLISNKLIGYSFKEPL